MTTVTLKTVPERNVARSCYHLSVKWMNGWNIRWNQECFVCTLQLWKNIFISSSEHRHSHVLLVDIFFFKLPYLEESPFFKMLFFFFYKLNTIYQLSLDFTRTHKQTHQPHYPVTPTFNTSEHKCSLPNCIMGIFYIFFPIRNVGLNNAIVSTHSCAHSASNVHPHPQMFVVYTGRKVWGETILVSSQAKYM